MLEHLRQDIRIQRLHDVVVEASVPCAATIRLLNRAGVDVVLPRGEICCGSLKHHMGREAGALAQARVNIDAWTRDIDPSLPAY